MQLADETGSPVTAFDGGPGYFGPVVVPVPEKEDADRLFEALRLLSTHFLDVVRGLRVV